MISLLYVDDESTLLEVTRVYLERSGEFSVKTSNSVKDAIELIKAIPFDAIVSDYQMPVMDGLEFLKHLRSLGNSVPFILFTGKGREEVAIEALNSGADFYLQKGGEPRSQFAELVNKVRQAVQRRQAEKALAASEEKYRELVENINDMLFTLGEDDTITYVSPMINQFGYTVGEVIGKPLAAFIISEDIPLAKKLFMEVKDGTLPPLEFRIVDAAGRTRFVRTSSRPIISEGKFTGIRGMMTDITEQKTAETRIMASEQRYHNVFEAAGDAMLVVDEDSGDILDANSAALYLFGYTLGEMGGMNYRDLLVHPRKSGKDERTPISGIPLRYYRSKEGIIFPADVLSSHFPQKTRTISIHSIRNITTQQHAEERALAAQRLYAVLSQINHAIIRVNDLQTLVAEICRISVEYGKFQMSWVGLLDHDSLTLQPVAHAGHEDGYLAATEKSGPEDKRRKSPIGTTIHEGRCCICNDIENDPRMEPWREDALKRGYLSSAAFPFRLHGKVVGAYMIYASRTDFFNTAEIALLEEIAMDISFTLDLLDEQARRTHAEQALAGSEERAGFLAEVLELSSQPFGIVYPEGGGFGIVNPAFCDLLGYTESELRSMTWYDITPQEYHDQVKACVEELSRTGISQRVEKEFIRKDKSRVPVELFLHRVVDNRGNTRYLYGFVTDISERKKVQEVLRSERDKAQLYLDTAGVMLAVLDREGTITLINRKGCEILGYSEEELLGKDWLSACLPERLRDEVRGVFDQIFKGETTLFESHENAVLTKDGEERVLAFHNTLLHDAQGMVSGILFSGEDITVQKQMEDALKGSEERFKGLIQNSSDMVRIIDEKGLIAYTSPSTLRITGYDPADIIGKNAFDLVHPEDREQVRRAFKEVADLANSGTPTEYRIRHADGHYIDVEAVALNLYNVAGINGIVTTTRPVTERKKAEQALLESEGRYRALFEKSADAIFVLTDRFIDCNPEAERLFGYTRDEIIGMTPADISPADQPGGRPSAVLTREYLQAALNGRTPSFAWVHCTKDGRPFPAQVTLIPAMVRGTPRVIAIVHDRTVQVREEQVSRHLSRIPELNPDPVIEVLRNREIAYANPASRTILREMGMPADPAAFIPEDFEAIVIAIQSEATPVFYREVRIGTALFGETLSYDPEESTIRIAAHEITTQVFERNALEQANRKLNILSGITRHDIKNKLTGVMGYLELAKGSTRDPEMIEYLSRAEISATAVKEQIEFTKAYENLGVKAPVWQDVSQVLARAIKLVDRGKVTIQDETSGLEIYADPMLEKVLNCLLENALAHGQQLTRIQVHGSPVPAGYLLVVEDDGVGIPSDRKEKVFNKKVGGESGFGLFLSREILSITGITIQETGDPGAGARFEISIPSGKFHIKSVG